MNLLVFKRILVPDRVFFERKLHKIKNLNSNCVIKEYSILLQNNKIQKLFLKTKHPNCHPDTKEFCLPKNIIDQEFSPKIRKNLEIMLMTYNLDDCYFKNWSDIKI